MINPNKLKRTQTILSEHYAWYVDEEESAGNIPLNHAEWFKEYGQIIIEKHYGI